MSTRTPGRSARFGAVAAALALIASFLAFATPAGAVDDTTRYGGSDRYETAALAALDQFPNSTNNNIVLASGENFPDGLAAAYLAGVAHAPLLLTEREVLPATTANALGALGGSDESLVTVHIVGGTAAVGQGVRNQLTTLGYELNEVGGANRYETAANAAATGNTLGGVGTFQGQRTAIVVTGENFPDALSAGSLAFAGSHPIILTTGGTLSSQADTTLDDLNIEQAIILGGTAAVSTTVETAIEAKGIDTVRVSGANRFGTAAALAETLVADEIDGGAGWDGQDFVLAHGMNFPDALAASQVGGNELAPIVLTGSVPTDTCNVLAANGAEIVNLFVMGGTAAISADTLNQPTACAEHEAPTATITAVDGRDSFTVEFSTQVINSDAAANYAVNNSTAGVTATAGPAGSNTVTVTLGSELQPNDLITVNPSGATDPIQTGAGGVLPLTNYTVTADTNAPTVTSARFFAGQGGGFVFFSEPVTFVGAEADITVGGAAGTFVSAVGGAPSTVYQATASAGDGGDSVQIPAGLFHDQATTPNANPAYTTQVTTDDTGPKLQSATYTTSADSAASIDVGGLNIIARDTGVAAGHLGNDWEVEATTTAGPGVTVQANATTKLVRIGAPNTSAVAIADLAIALANNPVFNANFYSEATGGGTADVDGNGGVLSGGDSNVVVTTQWSEPLRHVGDLDGNDLVPSIAGTTENQGPYALAPFGGQWVLSYTSDGSDLPTQIVPDAGDVEDLATNPNPAGAANVTAG